MMKKFTLLFVATLFSAMSFAALNPFAYGLSSSLNADQTELTVNYSLNAEATDVNFVLLDGETVIKTINLKDKGLAKGSYTATVALDDPNMPLGKKLSWKIEVKGNSVASPTLHDESIRFYLPYGLDCDVDPESDYLGNWYAIEAHAGAKGKEGYEAYQSYNVGRGLYAFDATLNPITNSSGTYGFTGGINVGATETNVNSDYVNFYRVATSGGRVFIGRFRDGASYHPIVEANPADLNANFTSVVTSGRAISIDARGSGENLKLVMLGTDYKMYEYDLGTAKSISAASRTLNKTGLTVARDDASIAYDSEGGVWFNQNRGTATEAQPTIAHVSVNGVDYNNVKNSLTHNNTNNSGIAVSPDGTKLAVVGAGSKKLTIYNISKVGGQITLTQAHVITVSAGNNHTALAFDYAGNLYAANRSSERIRIFAIPYSGTVATPCASKYEFTINSAAQMAKGAELNPYAYNLSSTWNNTNKTLTINYTLNANATSVDVVIMDGQMEMKRIPCSGVTRGSYTESISLADAGLPLYRDFTWKVDVKATSKNKPTQVSTYYSLYCPHGLAIDKNPESEYFGRIIAADAMQEVVGKEGYLSSGQGAGLYVFTPEFATDGKVKNGGIDFTRQWASYGYQPWRVKISDDGRIFVSSCDLNGKFVWELSKDLNTWTDVLARGQEKTSSTMKGNAFTTGGTFLAGMNLSMDVQGSGDDLKLLLYSASGTGITGNTQSLFRLDEYALGEASKWDNSVAPKNITYFNGNYGFYYTNVNVIYDGEGGYWFGASRGGNSGQPNLVHFKADGTRDYYSEDASFYGGDGILVHNGMLIKGKARSSSTVGNIGFYTIGKDASGNVTLTEKWTIQANHIGRNLNEFAVDYGENLYVVGNSGEKIIAFALPYSGTISTPAPAACKFLISGNAVAKTDKLNPFAYGLSSEVIDAGHNLKVNYSLNAQATAVKVVIMNGNNVEKTVDCAGLTKGTHTLTISTDDLPVNTDLTWKVVVNGTSVTNVEEYQNSQKLYHPSTIDIDNNPENETFGLILTNESLNEVKGKAGYLGSDYGSGIFAFNAAFEYQGKYNGGNTFTDKRPDNNSQKAYAPRRIRISDDGRIFVTSLNTDGNVLWEVDPTDMNKWSPVFTGLTQDAKKDLVKGTTFVAGPNAGFDVRGSGKDLQLLMLSANTDSYAFGQTGFRVSEYDLGYDKTWSKAPSKAFPHENFYRAGVNRSYFISSTSSQVQYDQDGGVWYIQNRGATTETLPGLVYFDKNGVEKYKALYDVIENGGFRFNHDFTKVAIASNKAVNIYSVSKDASGVPVLTHDFGFQLATVGRNINDFAWDYAGNLYAVGHSGERAVAYRLPYSGEVTTPAASKYTFQVVHEVTISELANDNTTTLAPYVGESVTVTVERNFEPNKCYTLTLPFDMNAAQISAVFGGAKVYNFYNVVEQNAEELYLEFMPGSSIQAGKPCLIVTPAGSFDANDGFAVEDVVVSTTPQPVQVGAITMMPVLDNGYLMNDPSEYYVWDGGLYCAGTYNMTSKGLRAYFVSSSPLPVRARVVLQDNEATSIPMVGEQPEEQIRKVLKDGQIIIIRGEEQYNMQGQKIQ
ncbi:MAG: hypothetical protein J6R26_01795 [Paludibacteraceae bacterium]|nr:hypothetical protein [Paludibacteraceae bacterium]